MASCVYKTRMVHCIAASMTPASLSTSQLQNTKHKTQSLQVCQRRHIATDTAGISWKPVQLRQAPASWVLNSVSFFQMRNQQPALCICRLSEDNLDTFILITHLASVQVLQFLMAWVRMQNRQVRQHRLPLTPLKRSSSCWDKHLNLGRGVAGTIARARFGS